MVIVGIDPGLKGAVAFLNSEAKGNQILVRDMPTVPTGQGDKREINLPELAALVKSGSVDFAVVEQVGAMPGQGVTSMFNFGRSYGGILGVLAGLGIATYRVTPGKWKKVMGVSSDKDQARRVASELMPLSSESWPLKKHDGRAEAALIALYGFLNINKGS